MLSRVSDVHGAIIIVSTGEMCAHLSKVEQKNGWVRKSSFLCDEAFGLSASY